MKSIKIIITGLLLIVANIKAKPQQPQIIPLPQQYTAVPQTFVLSKNTALVVEDKLFSEESFFLQKEILSRKAIPVSRKPAPGATTIRLRKNNKQVQQGAYSISMSASEVVISAAEEEGIFNGIISFLQLVSVNEARNGSILVNCWNIGDFPKYAWRGLMIDESRHFFGIEKIKSVLDWMAFYKLNRFHWHLTDEPAWRIEIKKYPMLALVGGIGSHTDSATVAKFYTQQQIKEVVAYAAERKIVVIPEIDMPGHARAANRAYPQFSGGGSEKYPDFTFDPGNPQTYQYLTDILREVDVLFPAKMIHLGGDEVSFGNEKWSSNAGVKKLMSQHRLKNLKDVEQYFMQRMADSLFRMNIKFLAWDEMANVKLPSDKTIIFWWRHDQKKDLQAALDNNYSVVLCPRIPFYFDFVQDSTHAVGRKWKNTYAALKDVYAFDLNEYVDKKQQQHVLGIQANVWTETIISNERLEYMMYPRISALAEAGWSATKDYDSFLKRLAPHLSLFQKSRIYYFDVFSPGRLSEPRM